MRQGRVAERLMLKGESQGFKEGAKSWEGDVLFLFTSGSSPSPEGAHGAANREPTQGCPPPFPRFPPKTTGTKMQHCAEPMGRISPRKRSEIRFPGSRGRGATNPERLQSPSGAGAAPHCDPRA